MIQQKFLNMIINMLKAKNGSVSQFLEEKGLVSYSVITSKIIKNLETKQKMFSDKAKITSLGNQFISFNKSCL